MSVRIGCSLENCFWHSSSHIELHKKFCIQYSCSMITSLQAGLATTFTSPCTHCFTVLIFICCYSLFTYHCVRCTYLLNSQFLFWLCSFNYIAFFLCPLCAHVHHSDHSMSCVSKGVLNLFVSCTFWSFPHIYCLFNCTYEKLKQLFILLYNYLCDTILHTSSSIDSLNFIG